MRTTFVHPRFLGRVESRVPRRAFPEKRSGRVFSFETRLRGY